MLSKIIKRELIEKPYVDVFDISVKEFHNFILSNGAVVHNCDTYQSADLVQQLSARGYDVDIVSVDRCDTDKICKPYQYFKSTIYEERIEMYDAVLLTEEIIGLERDNNSGKVDHSPAGVNCFVGDTKIRLVDGRSVKIKNLVDEYKEGKRNFVYSFNHETKRIEPKLIKKAWCSGHTTALVKVVLDNGEEILCTPDHRFMLRDGSYKCAKDLFTNESLMPLYTRVSGKGLKGYRMYYEPIEDKWHYEHREFAEEIFDEKYLVHHKDCNPLNNSPDNLIWMSKSAHNLEHARLQTGAQSEKARKKRSESVKKSHSRVEPFTEDWLRYYSGTTEERWEKYLANIKREEECQQIISDMNDFFDIDFESLPSDIQRRYRAKWSNVLAGNDVSKELGLSSAEKAEEQKKRQLEACEYYGKSLEDLEGTELQAMMIKYAHDTDPTYQQRVSEAVSENHAKGKYENAHTALQSYNDRCKRLKELCPTIDEDKFFEIFGFSYSSLNGSQKGVYSRRYREIVCKDILNHKVVEVSYQSLEEDVYDLEIEDNHNFALDSGIFVHNSKDISDAVCGSIFNASKHGEEFNFEYGETLDAMVDVSNEMSYDNTKAQMVIDFEEELKKVSMDFSSSLNVNNNKNTNPLSSYGFGVDLKVDDLAILDGIIL